MCGIFAYLGKSDAIEKVHEGLKKLEYRGYDSAGIAYIFSKQLRTCKVSGRVQDLVNQMQGHSESPSIALGHTRWATHGEVNEQNAHPHWDSSRRFGLVHNGIIENYIALKNELLELGETFYSETDTEILAKYLAYYLKSHDMLSSIFKLMSKLEGTFAVVVMDTQEEDALYAFTKESPLLIGVGEHENYLASDFHSFIDYTRKVVYLEDFEVARVSRKNYTVYNSKGKKLDKKEEEQSQEISEVGKGCYEHFTLKEIFEQSSTLSSAFSSRIDAKNSRVIFEEQEHFDMEKLKTLEHVIILACGTSWHAAYYAAYLLEERTELFVEVHISSEFRYRRKKIKPNTLVIAISQSGETADTLAAIKELKKQQAMVLGLCNVAGSTLARLADFTLYLRAGPEIGVCSTKAFTSQIVVLFLLCLYIERLQQPEVKHEQLLKALKSLPEQVAKILAASEGIAELAKRYKHHEHFFYLGRHYMLPSCLEGALKLKEISYINANAYPAGELKHGPIALISQDCPTLAFCCNEHTYAKMLSNIKEIKARKGKVIAILPEGDQQIAAVVDESIFVPKTVDELMIINVSVVGQLFAYYIAKEKGMDIDKPRNLAKSVTVE